MGETGLGFDLIEVLDVEEDGDGDFGNFVAEVGEFPSNVGEAGTVAESVVFGNEVVNL